MIQKQVILTFIKNSYIKHNKHGKKKTLRVHLKMYIKTVW